MMRSSFNLAMVMSLLLACGSASGSGPAKLAAGEVVDGWIAGARSMAVGASETFAALGEELAWMRALPAELRWSHELEDERGEVSPWFLRPLMTRPQETWFTITINFEATYQWDV